MTTVDSSSILQNYIASQTSSTATAEASNTTSLWGDFDTFLQILTAQLKNQDPTDPADASEFTQQLVQYAEVEQQISTNDKLDAIASTINSNGITPLLSYVGQYVEAESDGDLVVQNGQALLGYTLPSEALSVTINIQDESGNVIAQVDAPTEKGLNRVAWDGTLTDGTTAEDGIYSFTITAKDSSGDAIEISDMRVVGQVSSIETDKDGALSMMIGDYKLEDTDVLSVFALTTTSSSSSFSSSEDTSSGS
jgi:flagellar basal-body rod modification protein FlgD